MSEDLADATGYVFPSVFKSHWPWMLHLGTGLHQHFDVETISIRGLGCPELTFSVWSEGEMQSRWSRRCSLCLEDHCFPLTVSAGNFLLHGELDDECFLGITGLLLALPADCGLADPSSPPVRTSWHLCSGT